MTKIFQVETISKEKDLFSVAGRMIAGDSIHKGEVCTLIKTDDNDLISVHLTIIGIEMYECPISFIDLGCTANLLIEGNVPDVVIKELIIEQ